MDKKKDESMDAVLKEAVDLENVQLEEVFETLRKMCGAQSVYPNPTTSMGPLGPRPKWHASASPYRTLLSNLLDLWQTPQPPPLSQYLIRDMI